VHRMLAAGAWSTRTDGISAASSTIRQ
jgi:hypothetical protein